MNRYIEPHIENRSKQSLENPETPRKRVNIVKIKLVKDSSFLYGKRRISDPWDAYKLGKALMEDFDREHLLVCCLDTKNQPVNLHIVSVGSLNSAIVHPREVFKVAVLSNAASIILYHNHPSGDPTPSQEDYDATNRIKACGTLMGIELLDHIILGDSGYFSMREKGKL